ncbi:MAG: GTPase Era [Betaproteobacteria bacterium]|nr:GTPase Era [Betaproteobacteria bacterium]
MAAFRAGYIAIVGRPNVGKSTLLNRLVGQKISITSRRPQTTRHRVTGILTRDDAQLVFVDTPGFQTRHRGALNRLMNRAVAASVKDVDVVLWVIEALKFDEQDKALAALLPAKVPVVLAINKIDRVARKDELLPFIQRLAGRHGFVGIVPISARQGVQLEELLGVLARHLPEGPALYSADEITQANERILAAEFIREKVFRLCGEEIPYAVAVAIDGFTETGRLRRIHATIFVDKETQKPIVIGKGGEKLKTIATQARLDMEELFGGKVFLEIRVKVKPGWAEDEALLRRLGYE